MLGQYMVEVELGQEATADMIRHFSPDALVIATEWKEFRSPDFEAIKAALKNPLIFDGRNLYDPKFVRNSGIEYFAIGR